jgi:Holliday junction resolvasome RuvABC endonuclease subunit
VKVLALDLSLAATGYATVDEHDVIRTSPCWELPGRLDYIANRAEDLATNEGRDLVVIEDLPHHVAHGGTQLGMVHGVVRRMLWHHEAETSCGPVVLIPPASLKRYATGKGNASKADIRVGILQRFGIDIPDDNAADAFVLRAMALDHYGQPLTPMPQTHRQALDKVAWPQLEERAA